MSGSLSFGRVDSAIVTANPEAFRWQDLLKASLAASQ